MRTVHAIERPEGTGRPVGRSERVPRRSPRHCGFSVPATVLCACLLLSACAGRHEPSGMAEPPPAGRSRIAVFPVENLSGSLAPSRETRSLFVARLQAAGFNVLDDASLDRVMTRHRVRYTAGVDREVALALKKEAACATRIAHAASLTSRVLASCRSTSRARGCRSTGSRW